MRITCLTILILLTCSPASAQLLRIFDTPIEGQIAEVPIRLHAQANEHLFELRSISTGGAAYMYLLDSTGQEVTIQTIQAGSKISVPGNTSGDFTLVMRAWSTGIYTADLWVNESLHTRGVSFAHGNPVALPYIVAGEEFTAISPPGGAGSHTAYLVSSDGLHILGRARGVATTIRATPPFTTVIYAGTHPRANGRLLVYRNDRASDADADGVGDNLEAQLGTCARPTSQVTGVSCGQIASTKDTDSDGLWDSWEVFGKEQIVNGTIQVVPLPTWGSNPRHKDIFIEADFRRLTLQDNQSGLAEHMSPSTARALAATYADAATTDPVLRAAHAKDVGNPDGQPGISLHIDTGIASETSADAAIYGDWGGYTAVDAVPDGMGGYRPQNPYEAMANNLSDARRGLFHYVLGYMSGGGACGVGIACGFNMASVSNSSHEFGHTLFLDHNGPAGTHEPNCKPNYPSLMNYAFGGYDVFSDGTAYPTLNNHTLVETGIAANNPVFQNILRSTFLYRVDQATGSVDWNRDGIFQPANIPVRAYANFRPGNMCEFTREGEVAVGTKSMRSPAVVRHNGQIWIFTVTQDQKLEYSYTSSPWTCQKIDNCQQPSFPLRGVRDVGPVAAIDAATINVNGNWMVIIAGIRPDGTLFETSMQISGSQIVWGSPVAVQAAPAGGEPSLAVSSDGKKVVLAYKGTDQILRYRTRSSAGWQAEKQVVIGGVPFRMNELSSPGIAFTGLPAGQLAGQESLVGAFASANDGSFKLYALGAGFPSPGWVSLDVPHGGFPLVVGRPSLAWTGIESSSPRALQTATPYTVGRFYLVYPSFQSQADVSANRNPVRMAMSYVDESGTFRIGLMSYFDNVWSYAFGIDLLQPGEVGLRAAEVYAIPNVFSEVYFRPHADGISNLAYSNYNDWPVLAYGTCRVLSDAQPPAMKTACPDKTWFQSVSRKDEQK